MTSLMSWVLSSSLISRNSSLIWQDRCPLTIRFSKSC
jgi:hypothetical protein